MAENQNNPVKNSFHEKEQTKKQLLSKTDEN